MLYSIAIKKVLCRGTALAGLACMAAGTAYAQTTPDAATPTGAATPLSGSGQTDKTDGTDILVTGSRIKQNPNNSALPLQIVTTQELQRNSISSPEQLIAFLPDNGSGANNLASNSDVTTPDRRGNNGASFADLRGQGPAATLVLLNGLRLASQGTTGSAVDVNQIPYAALDRVEVLKDGASAIYGTDAVGGVINFITKKNYRGFGATAYSDVTTKGDAPIYRVSAIAGYGDLDDQGFNVMGTVGYSAISPLEAHARSFINTYQHDRGLSTDTRGSPFATIVSLAGTAFPTSAAFPLIPGTTTRATGGVNLLRLPGQAGCAAIMDEGDYDTDVWANPANGLACSYDTGKNVYLQQKLNTFTYLGRAVKRFGAHELSLEVTGSIADSAKKFSQVQITPNTSTQNYQYKLVPGVNDAAYAGVYNTLTATFPALRATIPYGSGFSFRWRCIECGEREIATRTTTFRAALGLEGPIARGWDYHADAQYADSISTSTLGGGYFYQDALVAALNSGAVNPFLFPGQTQSAAGLAAIQSASAAGVVLYGGKYSLKQGDASVSGSLFRLPGGLVKIAAGIDYRREEYKFNGDARALTAQRTIIAAPFDNANALTGVGRDIKAAYAEVLIPVFKGLEVSAAGRIDDYTGFGTTTNPKVSIKYRPFQALLFRGSYNTGFRVPAFNQIFNPRSSSIYTGSQFADPKNCPGGVVTAAPGCTSLNGLINIVSGGSPNLGPETAREFSGGIVIEPSRHFSASADYWSIKRESAIQVLSLTDLFANYASLQDHFIRNSAGVLTDVDDSYLNVGTTKTEGIDFTARGNLDALHGTVSVGVDGTILLKKTAQALPTAPVVSQLGVYSLADDLGLRLKYNAYVSYSNDDFSIALTQVFRDGYKNQVLPGIQNGTFNPPNDITDVDSYIVYNLSVAYTGVKGFKLTAGVRNLFDTDPPFAVSYNTDFGVGSSYEPRVADPRGRSVTMQAEIKF